MCVGGKYIVLLFEGLLLRKTVKKGKNKEQKGKCRQKQEEGECVSVSQMIFFYGLEEGSLHRKRNLLTMFLQQFFSKTKKQETQMGKG